MYNVYKNKRGQIVPKSAVIRNSDALNIFNELNEDLPINGGYYNDDEWVMIAISPSQIGNLYANVYGFSDKDYNILVNDYSIVFDDIEKLKNYLRWALNLPKHVVNNR